MSITNEEYQTNKKIIYEYEKEIRKKYIKPLVCICCKNKTIEPTFKDVDIDPITWKGNWDDGAVSVISCGYGSSHDLSSYVIAICDSCITNLDESGLILRHREIKKNYESEIKGYES